jgi:hypothetical protein
LDPDDEVHLMALHFIYIPKINEAIEQFVDQWNNHPLSTESNFSPRQLWTIGMLDTRNPASCAVQDVLTGNDIDLFGIDENEDYQMPLIEEEEPGIVVPTCPYEMTQEQEDALQNLLRLHPNDENGTLTFFAIREYLKSIF